jgi:hypothetical protein
MSVAPLDVTQPNQLKPTIERPMAPAAAPSSAGFVHTGIFMKFPICVGKRLIKRNGGTLPHAVPITYSAALEFTPYNATTCYTDLLRPVPSTDALALAPEGRPVEEMKSIAVPATRRMGTKPRRGGHPANAPDQVVGGSIGPYRKAAAIASTPPASHRYRIGQRLRLLGGGATWARQSGYCKVIALMPHEAGVFLYRVRSDIESFERVVAESDLRLPEAP